MTNGDSRASLLMTVNSTFETTPRRAGLYTKSQKQRAPSGLLLTFSIRCGSIDLGRTARKIGKVTGTLALGFYFSVLAFIFAYVFRKRPE